MKTNKKISKKVLVEAINLINELDFNDFPEDLPDNIKSHLMRRDKDNAARREKEKEQQNAKALKMLTMLDRDYGDMRPVEIAQSMDPHHLKGMIEILDRLNPIYDKDLSMLYRKIYRLLSAAYNTYEDAESDEDIMDRGERVDIDVADLDNDEYTDTSEEEPHEFFRDLDDDDDTYGEGHKILLNISQRYL